jgi:hypothetical protein
MKNVRFILWLMIVTFFVKSSFTTLSGNFVISKRSYYFALITTELKGHIIRIRMICSNLALTFRNSIIYIYIHQVFRNIKFEVLTSMTMKASVFGGVTLYSAGNAFKFQRNVLLYLQVS